jgi:hypothetical protein
MFCKKKRSWYWLALGSVIFSGIFYGISRFFKRAVEKDSGNAADKRRKIKKTAVEELFI